MAEENAAFCGKNGADGYRQAALALMDATEGQLLWNAALKRGVSPEVGIEICTVFLAMVARELGQTPRAACEAFFKECPADGLWIDEILPLMDELAMETTE